MKENINLINFTDLSLEEKKMVLKWRNHLSVRKWMYTQEEIPLENHLKFIESLNQSNNKLYFLVKKDDNYLGVIDFTNIMDNSTDIGLYANPKLRGVGQILIDIIIEYAFDMMCKKKLVAEALESNVKARELYKKNNFIETNKKVFNKLDVICMELKNENRKI